MALLPVVVETDSLSSLMELHTKLVWKLLGTCDHGYSLNLTEFSKIQKPLSLAAFEQYIRGLLANDDETRLRDLKEAVHASDQTGRNRPLHWARCIFNESIALPV